MLYTVGEMAKLLGVQPSTLRYYDKEGLLPFVERSGGGIRLFTERDYQALKVIGCLKKSGLSIKEIKSFIEMADRGDDTIAERLELFRSRREAVLAEIRELESTLGVLNFKCWYYETALSDGTEARVGSMSGDEIPEQYRAAKKQLDLLYQEGRGETDEKA